MFNRIFNDGYIIHVFAKRGIYLPNLGFLVDYLEIFTARRVCIAQTMLLQDVCLSICPSVRLSVCHTLVFCGHR